MLYKFAILTLGCKVNSYESQQIRQLLESFGLAQVEPAQAPPLVVINTCCVTHTASAKSRNLIHRAQKHGPAAIIVCGCLPAIDTDELKALGDNVHVVKNRCDLATTLSRLVHTGSTAPDPVRPGLPPAADTGHTIHTSIRPESESKVKSERDLCPCAELPPLVSFQHQTRAYLKVQDGCDASCSYCIIPTARPVIRFKKLEEILAEATALVRAGHKEIVVAGVHLGSYGQTTARRQKWPNRENPHLPALLDQVARIPGLARIRLSSLDPEDVTPALLMVFRSHPNLLSHLHLSLQSGSDDVLRRMGRLYTADEFRARVARIRGFLDRPAITTDIIVGFPGETDADFEQTVALAREVAFSRMHVFGFSARKGTAAARMQPKVPPEVKKARSKVLRDLDQGLQSQFRAQFLGETAQVLIETSNGHPSGRAERYFEVEVVDRSYPSHQPCRSYSAGDIVTVRLDENSADGVLATALDA